MTPSDRSPDVCVIGRTDFATGIGSVGFAAAEMFSRSFNTCYLPLDPELRREEHITLPNGRSVVVCRDTETCNVFFFTGVLWNGVEDFNYRLVPKHGLRLAHVNFDSDRLPKRWVELLNESFDGAVVPSRHLVEVLRSSGVKRPISVVPVALDLDQLLAQSAPFPAGATVRFCSVGAFHPRKGADLVVEAFAEAFADSPNVSLRLHSNLAFGDTLDRLRARVMDLGVHNVEVTHGHLSEADTQRLISQSEVFVSCSGGEGYSIPPRQALAAGRAVVISAAGGHLDLLGPPGVFPVEPRLRVPARYPEIDNGLFGERGQVQVGDIVTQLRAALTYARSAAYARDVPARRARASAFTFSRLVVPYCELIDFNIRTFRRDEPPHPIARIPNEAAAVAVSLVGSHGSRLRDPGKRVVLAHDGGFFSVFNTFLSHLVWDLRDPRCHMVLPDWDVARIMRIRGVSQFTSFCYGRPGDGNLWLRLFEAPFDLNDESLDDESFLWDRASCPTSLVNESREPHLTYVHAHRLYRDRDFPAIRIQYHRAYRQHVHIRPPIVAEVDQMTRAFQGRFMIGAHVRHPSHSVEQPGGVVPGVDSYLERVRALVDRKGIRPQSDDWGLFLATDQERVVARFREEFGEHVLSFPDVRRTTAQEDQRFESLSAADRSRDGNQLQHLVAADRTAWGIRMAEEVVRDALALSRCSTLLHVVSNVATAVAFMNPALEMELMIPDADP